MPKRESMFDVEHRSTTDSGRLSSIYACLKPTPQKNHRRTPCFQDPTVIQIHFSSYRGRTAELTYTPELVENKHSAALHTCPEKSGTDATEPAQEPFGLVNQPQSGDHRRCI
ncbi:hypothetical protein CIRG_05096 [Coccidioides immitis RMSCC 2394]|uniref:Uncharacterized protein n=1 Tax=Coccidioides immitis RMSCC 2394 TaxID=404692 RepID=A0A0J6YCF5_COCIT|nr:hypothetical protein CIRG_05096 [Coccidioides immitis RMSCC 2394]